MCRTWALLTSDDMPLPAYVKAVRRFSFIDVLIAIYFAILVAEHQTDVLKILSVILAFAYFLCAAVLLLVTAPDKVMLMTPRVLHSNTGLNVLTLLLNIGYSVMYKVQNGTSPLYFSIGLIVCVFKVARVYAIHKMAMRLKLEGPSAFVKVNTGIINSDFV